MRVYRFISIVIFCAMLSLSPCLAQEVKLHGMLVGNAPGFNADVAAMQKSLMAITSELNEIQSLHEKLIATPENSPERVGLLNAIAKNRMAIAEALLFKDAVGRYIESTAQWRIRQDKNAFAFDEMNVKEQEALIRYLKNKSKISVKRFLSSLQDYDNVFSEK